ncbi:Polyketide cyclase/dehydrase [Actinobacteria bacterium OK074]|nr:Polyketide cyclase/dehydrase [Actinobacteria bacterium OK074]
MTGHTRSVSHRAVVAAPAAVVHGLVADVAAGARLFPGQLHAELLADGLVRRWVLADEGVRSWVVRRVIGTEPLTISFDHHEPPPPVRAVRGAWSFRPLADGTTEVSVRHDVTVDDPGRAERMVADLDRNVPRQLDGYRWAAERWHELARLLVRAEGSAAYDGALDEVYGRFRAAAGPASVCLPGLIVVKEPAPEPWLRAVTGRWTFAARPAGGVLVTAAWTATLAEQADRGRAETLVTAAVRATLDGGAAGPSRDGHRPNGPVLDPVLDPAPAPHEPPPKQNGSGNPSDPDGPSTPATTPATTPTTPSPPSSSTAPGPDRAGRPR